MYYEVGCIVSDTKYSELKNLVNNDLNKIYTYTVSRFKQG